MFSNRFNVHYYERYVNLEIWGTPLLCCKSQPDAGPARLEVQDRASRRCQASSVPPPYRLPPGNKGAYWRHPTLFDGHVLSHHQFHASYN
jgi:hypothetical protein